MDIFTIFFQCLMFTFICIFFKFFQQCFILFSIPPWLNLTSLIKFIPKYFIVFDAFVNWIAFLISFSNMSLLVYRKTTDFCMLILYPVTLLNAFTSSNYIFGGIFWVLYTVISYTCKQIILLLLFQSDAF